jgi:microcompartment protein CcmK/EutM
MKSAQVVGRVVSTRKVEALAGVTLLLLKRTSWDNEPLDDYIVAADAVGAGAGEHVFFVEARDASIAVKTNPPVDAAIVGIIDGVDLGDSC